MKTCSKCGIEKDEALFGKNKNTTDKLSHWCKECNNYYYCTHREQQKAQRATRHEELRAYFKNYNDTHREERNNSRLKREYDLSPEDINKMILVQENKCLICKKEFTAKKGPAVDHDHVSGKVRGLLHRTCNLALGIFKDDPEICRGAADYLESYKKPLTNVRNRESIESEEGYGTT